jgi:uncharacterized protein with HEPN domain
VRRDRDFLVDILERISLTEEFVQSEKNPFFTSRLVREAVTRNLEVIGAASRALSDDFKQQYPEIPWRQIAAFRNFAIHTYWAIKADRLWEIIEKDLPSLKAQVTALLAQIDLDAPQAGQEDQ